MNVISRGRANGLRKGRWSAKGQVYLVTSCTLNRDSVFADFYLARKLINILKRESESGTCTTLAYVVMPDHLHWLMQLENGGLSLTVGRVKSLVAKGIGRPVWQAGFHDHCLRREEDIRGVARYIVMNPVRAGLVEKPGLYPHWDMIWL